MRAGGARQADHDGDARGGLAWRVLSDAAQDGPRNMALDEAIARAVEAGQVAPTVRFYAWDTRTVSLGYLQTARGAVERGACDRLGVQVVRRLTGGRAVLHACWVVVPPPAPLAATWRTPWLKPGRV